MPRRKTPNLPEKEGIPRRAITPKPTEGKNPSDSTKHKVEEIAYEIAKTAMPRRTAVQWIMERYGYTEATARGYYQTAMRYLRPDNPQEYREQLIDRNFATLEEMLHTALERNDLKNANAIIRTMNSMCGVGGKQVEIKRDSDNVETITISFD